MSQERFTIEQFKKYIQSQDSLGDVLYNLNASNIRKANIVEIKFKDDIIGDDFEVNDEDNLIESMEEYLDDVRNFFEFDAWDELEGDDIIYFEYKGVKYEFTFEYGDCVEATHEHRIMELKPIVKEYNG